MGIRGNKYGFRHITRTEQRESLEGKSVACQDPMHGALFAFSLLWPADGSGRVGMAQTK